MDPYGRGYHASTFCSRQAGAYNQESGAATAILDQGDIDISAAQDVLVA